MRTAPRKVAHGIASVKYLCHDCVRMEPHDGCFDLRPFAHGDLQQALSLIRTAIQAGAKFHYSETQIAAWISNQGMVDPCLHCCTLVAVTRGMVVGFAGADLRNTYQILFVFVAPHLWRRGIGRALVSSLEQFCAKGEVREIYVAAALNAVGFYKALGYATQGSVTLLLSSEDGGSDLIRMPAVAMSKSVCLNSTKNSNPEDGIHEGSSRGIEAG
jgi:GNAT superfamily N-acetyltransferase